MTQAMAPMSACLDPDKKLYAENVSKIKGGTKTKALLNRFAK
jgi:hypothetical protein